MNIFTDWLIQLYNTENVIPETIAISTSKQIELEPKKISQNLSWIMAQIVRHQNIQTKMSKHVI